MNRREWAIMLGSICSPAFPKEAVEALVDMLPLLAEWPDDYFTAETMKDVALAKRRQSTPAYDEIVGVFAALRRDNLPVHIRMGGSSKMPAIVEQFVPATEAEKQRVAQLLAEESVRLNASAAAKMAPEQRVKPNYLYGVTLAKMRQSAGIPLSPDLQAALNSHENPRGV